MVIENSKFEILNKTNFKLPNINNSLLLQTSFSDDGDLMFYLIYHYKNKTAPESSSFGIFDLKNNKSLSTLKDLPSYLAKINTKFDT